MTTTNFYPAPGVTPTPWAAAARKRVDAAMLAHGAHPVTGQPLASLSVAPYLPDAICCIALDRSVSFESKTDTHEGEEKRVFIVETEKRMTQSDDFIFDESLRFNDNDLENAVACFIGRLVAPATHTGGAK